MKWVKSNIPALVAQLVTVLVIVGSQSFQMGGLRADVRHNTEGIQKVEDLFNSLDNTIKETRETLCTLKGRLED